MILDWFFGKKERGLDYGSRHVSGQEINKDLNRIGITRRPIDDFFLDLKEDSLKALVKKYHQWEYSRNGFPDCDDIALFCVADVLRGAAKEGFDAPPPFRLLTYTRLATGVRHQLCVAYSFGRVLLYEPQTAMWLDPKDEIDFNSSAVADL